MTNLDCNVSCCCHNDNSEKKCCLSSINVRGTGASTCDDTCCGSFFEDKSGSVSNANNTPHVTLDISCDADSCVYNDNSKCTADHIDISGIFASAKDDTVCATYKSRN